jgi:hypothetical protein
MPASPTLRRCPQPKIWVSIPVEVQRRDLYELAKILGHANIKMTERYAKLAKKDIARTGNTAREMWKLMEVEAENKIRMFPHCSPR